MSTQTDNVTMNTRSSLLMMLSTHDDSNNTAVERSVELESVALYEVVSPSPEALSDSNRFGALALAVHPAVQAHAVRAELGQDARALPLEAQLHAEQQLAVRHRGYAHHALLRAREACEPSLQPRW